MLSITLSKPSKMPCHGYSLPASRCKVGSKLRKVEGSTCSHCYAMKGNYTFPKVQACLENRLEATKSVEWVTTMVALISKTGDNYFRWHDSGDLQDLAHMEKIVEVAKALPHVKFWLPTREYGIVTEYLLEHGAVPNNLTVRLSAHMVGQRFKIHANSLPTSTVGANYGHVCPSRTQGNKCQECRACWDPTIGNVDYIQH